jgi:hypothetical protein
MFIFFITERGGNSTWLNLLGRLLSPLPVLPRLANFISEVELDKKLRD